MNYVNYQKKKKKSVIGLMLICLMMLSISSCGPTKTITVTEYVYVTPSSAYLQHYDIPELGGTKNKDLLYWALDLQELLEMHNADKAALRDWKRMIDDRNNGEDDE